MISRLITLYAASLLFVAPAFAQNAPAAPVAAVIEKFDGQKLTAKSDAGKELSVTVPNTIQITRVKHGSIADVKAGLFVHSLTMEAADGKLTAKRISILSDPMRATAGDGNTARKDIPHAFETNGNIDAMTAGAAGERTIQIGYKGGQSEVKVPADADVNISTLTSPDALKPGTKIDLYLKEAPPGTWTAYHISVRE